MQQTGLNSTTKSTRKTTALPRISAKAIMATTAFFIGRVVIFQSINPLTPALIGCFSFSGSGVFISIAFSFFGLLTRADINCFTKYIIYLALMFILNIILPPPKGEKANMFKAICSGCAILVAGLIYAIINSFSIYYTLIAVLESILTFSLAIVLGNGVEFIKKNDFTSPPQREDILSLALIIGAIIGGSADLNLSGVPVSLFFSTLAVMGTGFVYGTNAGIACSVMITLVMAISSSYPIEIMCIFSTATIFATFSPKIKRKTFAFIFTASAFILALYLKKSILQSGFIYAFVGAVVVFLFIPFKRIEQIKIKPSNEEEFIKRLRSLTTQRLKEFSASFSKLSRTLSKLSEKRLTLDQKDVSTIIDDVSGKLCAKCDLRPFCWEQNFYITYQNIFSMLENCEKFGEVKVEEVGGTFLDNCFKKEKFINTLNRTFDIYKNNLSWENKIIESRELVSQQLTGVSSIIDKLSEELNSEIKYNKKTSELAVTMLEENGVYCENVVVSENKDGKNEVLIKHLPCYGNKDCTKKIIPIINDVMKTKFCKDCSQCIMAKENKLNLCTLKLVEAKEYGITPAVVSAKKDGSLRSGDSTIFIPLPDGKYLLALSDGMGSGNQAQKESSATLELFEDFISAGFNKETALNMINSVLVLKSSQDSFSTLDVCTVDLHTGIAEFIKIGAVTSFIKRKGQVEVIKSNSLPVGILSKIDSEITKKQMFEMDLIVMVSDGVLDSSNSLNNKEGFIIKALEENDGYSPNKIADEILQKAISNNNGQIKDDMTVMVAKIFRRG